MENKVSPVSNLLEQIRQLNNLLLLHKNDDDEFMLNQYKAKKWIFQKELLSELIKLNETSPKVLMIINQMFTNIKELIPVINEIEFSKKNHISLADLETVVYDKVI